VIARLLDDPLAASIPLLGRAARAFGTRQVRNRATVGGNIASGLPDRTLSPCLLALEATVHIESLDGARELPIAEFLTGPGRTALGPGEIITAVTVPRVEGFQDYTMIGPRNAQFYVTVSVALVVDAAARGVRLGLGNAGPTALRAREAEAFARTAIDWDNGRVSEDTAREFGEIAATHCDPPSDVTSSAAYRRHAVGVMARRILSQAFETPAA
jgi:CO/xanthine dehydrogenase FAD-binding subunit